MVSLSSTGLNVDQQSVCGLSFASAYRLTGAGAGFFVGRAVVCGLDMAIMMFRIDLVQCTTGLV